MQEQTILITGANAGIGWSTAKALLAQGAHLLVHARNETKAQQAREDLLDLYPNARIQAYWADFSSLAQVRSMATRISHAHPRLDILINNAGMLTSFYQETEEGFELQFGVNHLAPFLLTNLLLPNLEAAPAARVINVSSDGHYRAKSPFPTWTPDTKYEGFLAYCQSKLCNVLFTTELARRTQGSSITTNCLHPGVVSTGIGQKHTGTLGWFWRFMRPFFMNSEKGAATSLYLATSPEVAQISGKYFDDRKEKKPASIARDAQLAQELWTRSEEMVGMGREA